MLILKFLLPLIIIALLMAPLVNVYRGVVTGKRAKNRLILNIACFAGICLLGVLFPLGSALAADPATTAAVADPSAGLKAIGAALAVGISGIGGGIGIASAASAAIGSVSEDPKNFGRAIVFVAFAESIALYGFLIAFLLI